MSKAINKLNEKEKEKYACFSHKEKNFIVSWKIRNRDLLLLPLF